MLINLTWDSSVASAPAAFKTAVEAAAKVFDTQILNNITVSIAVGWGEDGGSPVVGGALATGEPTTYSVSYASLTSALQKAAVANGVSSLVANIPAADPTSGAGTWVVSSAQAQALGLNVGTSSSDGHMGFATAPLSLAWSYVPNQTGISQFDFIDTALHEISHALGRVNLSTGSYTTGAYGALNLYTYASPGNLQLGIATPAYFSVDGGSTNLNNFDMSSNGDPGDWTINTDSFGGGTNALPAPMSTTDWLVMESLGYHVAPTYLLSGPNTVNEGAHDYVKLSTVNVAAGTNLSYSISGISSSALDSNSLTGNVTVGSDGTAVIDLGISSAAQLSSSVQATLSLANTSYSVTVANTTNNIVNMTGTTYTPVTTNETIHGVASDVVSYYTDPSAYFSIIVPSSGTIQVNYLPLVQNSYGAATLIGPQRLQFSDTNVAFDLGSNQSAGQAVEVLGAAFGTPILSNATDVGIAIKLFDGGDSMQQVAQIATGYVSSASDYASFVKTVWLNVVGSQIDATNLAMYTNLLNTGQYTEASLLALAATTSANQNHVGLVGLAAHGIDYTPA